MYCCKVVTTALRLCSFSTWTCAVVVIRVAVRPIRQYDRSGDWTVTNPRPHTRVDRPIPRLTPTPEGPSDRSVLRTTPGVRHFGTLLWSWRRQRWELRRLGATVRCFIMRISHATQAHTVHTVVAARLSVVYCLQCCTCLSLKNGKPWKFWTAFLGQRKRQLKDKRY